MKKCGITPQLQRGTVLPHRLLLDGSGAAAYSLRMMKRMLPTGMTSLREIRELDCYYVDKTDHARRLVERGKYYFLSRPRRFGKSLLVEGFYNIIPMTHRML